MTETVVLFIISGLGAILFGAVMMLITWMRSHEQTCGARWSALMKEHGELVSEVRTLMNRRK